MININKCLNCIKNKCQDACIIKNNVKEIIRLYKNNKEDEALDLLLKTNPIPLFTGALCRGYCMQKCNYNGKEMNVDFPTLELYLGLKELDRTYEIKENNKKIAIIGAGVSGLSLAVILRKKGYFIDVYDKNNFIGGIIYQTVPDYKFKNEYLDKLYIYLKNLGINFFFNKKINTKDELDEIKTRYDHVISAIGLSSPRRKKYEVEGYEYALQVLKKIKKDPERISEYHNVYIYGLGNVAVDLAILLKKGNINVKIVYHKPKELARIEPKEYDMLINYQIPIIFDTRIDEYLGQGKIGLESNGELTYVEGELIIAIGQVVSTNYQKIMKEMQEGEYLFIGDVVTEVKNVTYAILSAVGMAEKIINDDDYEKNSL